jgi:hypothetical protein
MSGSSLEWNMIIIHAIMYRRTSGIVLEIRCLSLRRPRDDWYHCKNKNLNLLCSQKCYIFISSPEPKVQGELLVSKGDAPASVIMRQQSSSSLEFSLGRFTSNLDCCILVTVTLKFAHAISIGPFLGAKNKKTFKHLLPLN